MHVSGQHSEKACKQYRKAIGLQIWANESTFYQNLCSLLIAHVKQYLRQTVFHPAKILMRMDLAGGTLSMEGLEVLRMCETDGDKYIRNTIICCSVDISIVVVRLIHWQNALCHMSIGTLMMPMEEVNKSSGMQGT